MIATRRSVVLLVLAASCAKPSVATNDDNQSATASAPASAAATATGTPATRVKKNPNLIVEAEFREPAVQGMDALKAIRFLRPSFFRVSGDQSFVSGAPGFVQMSMDYGPLQPVRQLSAIQTTLLYAVRYLDANEAQNRFGLNANGGPVIVLLSSKHSQ
jgi:hypothetical protein